MPTVDGAISIHVVSHLPSPRNSQLLSGIRALDLGLPKVFGVDATRWGVLPPAVPGTSTAETFIGRRLSNGEIACALAHLRHYQDFLSVAGTPEWALVIEDDMDLDFDYVKILAGHLTLLQGVKSPCIISLGETDRGPLGVGTPCASRPSFQVGDLSLHRCLVPPVGTGAYFINRRAAVKATRITDELLGTADWPLSLQSAMFYLVDPILARPLQTAVSTLDVERTLISKSTSDGHSRAERTIHLFKLAWRASRARPAGARSTAHLLLWSTSGLMKPFFQAYAARSNLASSVRGSRIWRIRMLR